MTAQDFADQFNLMLAADPEKTKALIAWSIPCKPFGRDYSDELIRDDGTIGILGLINLGYDYVRLAVVIEDDGGISGFQTVELTSD